MFSMGISGAEGARFEEEGRNPLFIPPYANLSYCKACGETLEPVVLRGVDELPEGLQIDYRILGGFNNNTISFEWTIKPPADGYEIEWVVLKTFTGAQLKYISPKKRSPLLFALADEDAYAYCDEDVCLECIFMCKRGFVLYAAIRDWGIVKLPLERAVATGSRGE